MKKNVKIIISIILCVLIVSVGGYFIYNNNSKNGEKKSKEFIKAINYIEKEKYVDAYNVIKKSDKNEIDIIQTIILDKFSSMVLSSVDVQNEIYEEIENINDYINYPSLYSKDSSYQQKIDKIYDEKYPEFYKMKTKIPSNIMFDDTLDFYNLYFEYLDLDNGLMKNYEYNVLNNKEELLNKISNISDKLKKITEEYERVVGLHPTTAIPEEYKLLLSID